jgi:mRNA-degrading endonuclease RelE of RelBE toxin-antitoxin system
VIIDRSERFKKAYKKLPRDIQERVKKTLLLFAENHRHPSLGNKKMEGTENIWELRVTQGCRITYEKIPGGVFLRRVGTHDILRNP